MNAAEQAKLTECENRAAEYRANWVREESKRILLEQALAAAQDKANSEALYANDLRRENASLFKERDAAMAVLAPSMPSSGLVDAAKQVKQVAITEKANAETLEAENARLRAALETMVRRHVTYWPDRGGGDAWCATCQTFIVTPGHPTRKHKDAECDWTRALAALGVDVLTFFSTTSNDRASRNPPPPGHATGCSDCAGPSEAGED